MPTKKAKTAKKLAIDPKVVAKAAQIELARRDLVEFIRYVIRDEDGNSVIPPDHQIAWRDHLRYCWDNAKACCVLAPMSFSKSVTMAIALPLWLLGQNENIRIIMVSSAKDVAAKRLQDIQRYITDSPQYREVFPWVVPDYTRPWTRESLNVVRRSDTGGFVGSIDHSLTAVGYTAKIADGARAECVIFDDVASDGNSSSESERNRLFSHVTTIWLTRAQKKTIRDRNGNPISRDSLKVMIGTRYHEEDIYQSLPMAAPGAWTTLIQAVSQDYTHLDWKLIGLVAGKPHPIVERFGAWVPATTGEFGLAAE